MIAAQIEDIFMTAIVINFPTTQKQEKNLFSKNDVETLKATVQKYLTTKNKAYVFSGHLQSAGKGLFSLAFTNEGPINKDNLKKMLSFYNLPNLENWLKIKDISLYYHVTASDIWNKFKSEEDAQEFPEINKFMESFNNMPSAIMISYFEQLQTYSNTINLIEFNNPGIVEFSTQN